MDRADRRRNIVHAESSGEDHVAALRDRGRARPVHFLAGTAAHALVQEHGRQLAVDPRPAFADDRPALDRVRHVQCVEIVDIGLQYVGRERLEHFLPLVLRRVAHHGDAPHPLRQVLRQLASVGGRHAPHGLREHETDGIGTRAHRRLDVLRLAQATDFDEQAHAATLALPAARIAATRPAGSSLRISALPTSARP
jgi:transposase